MKPDVPGRPTLPMVKNMNTKAKARHADHQTAIGVDVAGVHAVIDHTYTEEERSRDQTVAEHLEDSALHTLLVGSKDTHGHKAHMRHRRIGNQLLDIFLNQRHQRGVDDGDGGHPQDDIGHHLGAHREHRQREAQEAVAAHLQQDRRQHHGTCSRRLHVRIRQPSVYRPHRHLHRKGGEEGQEQQCLHAAQHLNAHHIKAAVGELMRQKFHDISGARASKYIATIATSISTEPKKV